MPFFKKEHLFNKDNIIDKVSFSANNKVPLILQAEIAECGLACIAMISSFYGHKINIQPLRRLFKLDTGGLSLKKMMDISNELGFSCRAIKCSLDEVENLITPCILHWDMQHFVVLKKVTSKYIYINDPAIGCRKVSLSEFSGSFTGVALELSPTASFTKKNSKVVMRIEQLWSKISGLKRNLLTLFLLSLVLQFISLLSPYYMQWVIDHVLITNDKSLLVVLAVGFFILMLLRVLINSFRSWLIIKLSNILSLQIGSNLFYHLLRLPMPFFEKRHIGDVVSKFGSFSTIKQLLTTGLVEGLIDGLMSCIIVIVIYTYSPKLTLIVFTGILISFIIQLVVFYRERNLTQELIIAEAKEDTIFLESINSMQAIKLFSQQSNRQNTWLNSYADVINSNIKLGRLGITEDAALSIISGLEYILIIYFGSLLVVNGDLTVGMLLAFIAYKDHFSYNIHGLINKLFSYKMIGLHLERLSDITLEEREGLVNESHRGKNLKYIGSIKLENVSFRHSDSSEWIIHNLDLDVNAGESVAITGSSGCGKTTLLKIILGLLKPTSGAIFIDGININDTDLDTYRSLFGAVMQNDSLFSGTILENIVMFSPQYDEGRLLESCKLACILDDINKMPMGFFSLITNQGNNLSGGQYQRILLARALYKQPKILCLDESTSHLDTENESRINDNMKRLSITRVIIAHRRETIESADRVFNMEPYKSKP